MGDAEENIHNHQKIRCSFLGSPCFCLNQVVRRRDIALKIKEVSEKVDEIAKAKAMYGFQLYKATDHELQRPTSTHFFDESRVSGRDGEKKSVVSMLLVESSQEAQDVDVISLVGLGGIGKTTLAQLAFNDAEVVAHFEKKIWVCVSEPFDERVGTTETISRKLRTRKQNSSDHSAKGLRSLLIGNSGYRWYGAALPDVMKQLTCIRSLNVSGSSIKEIPKEVGKLIHLRHLNLEGCRELVSLPETMCDLCNLQSLDVFGCSSLKELPRAIVKLINLRHLRIHRSGVVFIPKGIERLTCLRTLDWFIVCGGGENESKAANLRELKNLDHIGGRLAIKNLRGGGIEDAAEAQLKNKKRLLYLELDFNHNHEDGNLIEVLQPPSDLERLYISGYRGILICNWGGMTKRIWQPQWLVFNGGQGYLVTLLTISVGAHLCQ
ncbi:hypothetical protein OIU76_000074 [Salix suchowensis]|nr:hypothetical protein OIU76_000074 [Salix suchowensis]